MNPKPIPVLDVGAALVIRGGRYLVTQRLEGDSFGGFWEIPGGKVEPGEKLEDCVVRELMEELAIKVDPRKFFRTVDYSYPHLTVRLHIYLCRLVSGEPQKIECQDYAWATPAELPTFRFPEADQTLVHELSQVDPESLF